MKKLINICSAACAIAALITLIFGIRALTGHGYLIGLRVFGMAQRGTFMGFIGNLTGIAIACAGFGAMAFFGFSKAPSAKRKGFLWGIAMTVICVVSGIAAIVGGWFTFGDLIIAALPAIYTYGMFRSA